MTEQVAVLGEMRDQLKRIADVLEKLATAELILPVEIGEPMIRLKPQRKRKNDRKGRRSGLR